MDLKRMFADQNQEQQDEQFGAGDIYLPDLTDLQAQGISTEGMQVSSSVVQGSSAAEAMSLSRLLTCLKYPERPKSMCRKPHRHVHDHGYDQTRASPPT